MEAGTQSAALDKGGGPVAFRSGRRMVSEGRDEQRVVAGMAVGIVHHSVQTGVPRVRFRPGGRAEPGGVARRQAIVGGPWRRGQRVYGARKHKQIRVQRRALGAGGDERPGDRAA